MVTIPPNNQPTDPAAKSMAETSMAYMQAIIKNMAAAIDAQNKGYQNLLLFANEFEKLSTTMFGKLDIKGIDNLEKKADAANKASLKVSESIEDIINTSAKLYKIEKAQAVDYSRAQMFLLKKKQVEEKGSVASTNEAIRKLREHQKVISKTTGWEKLNDVISKQIPGVGALVSAFRTMTPAALAITGVVEVFKQLWQYGNLSAKAVNIYTMEGGILNDSLSRSTVLTKRLASSFVDTEDSMKTASAIVNNYGFATNEAITSVDALSGSIRYSRDIQDKLTSSLYDTSVYLAKMGPMFGMTGEQLGKVMGEMSARFHMSMTQLMPAFKSMATLAMGLGVSTNELSNIFLKAGEQLRWFSRGGGLEPVMNRFNMLGVQMVKLSGQATSFWANLRPGEMMDVMQKVADLWSKTGAETYIALRKGAAPTTMAGLASGIEAFYTKEPIEVMRDIATGYAQKLEATGMTQKEAFLMLSRVGPFAEMGRAAPAMLEVLSSMTEEQMKASGAAGDMNRFLDIVAKRFPDQAKDLERIRETQAIMEDPLKTLVRFVQKILYIIAGIAAKPLIGAGTVAAKAMEGVGEPSPATKEISRPRGI